MVGCGWVVFGWGCSCIWRCWGWWSWGSLLVFLFCGGWVCWVVLLFLGWLGCVFGGSVVGNLWWCWCLWCCLLWLCVGYWWERWGFWLVVFCCLIVWWCCSCLFVWNWWWWVCWVFVLDWCGIWKCCWVCRLGGVVGLCSCCEFVLWVFEYGFWFVLCWFVWGCCWEEGLYGV